MLPVAQLAPLKDRDNRKRFQFPLLLLYIIWGWK
jgi:hypothetical protein